MSENEWPKKVRTTMRPDEEIEVEEREYVDLERQGLLHQQEQKESGEAAPADEKPARSRRDQ